MPWSHATHAFALLAVDPKGLAGAVIRARCGPVRDAFLEALCVLPRPVCKVHSAMEEEAIFGGIDLTETLKHQKMIERTGLISTAGTVLLPMAERCDAQLAARLAQHLDDGQSGPLIALDEGAQEDEYVPSVLSERLALHITLNMSTRDIGLIPYQVDINRARQILKDVRIEADQIHQLVELCLALGIHSQRAPLFALNAARANAALDGRTTIGPDDIETAAAFCLSHRATQLPPQPEAERDNPTPESAEPEKTDEMTATLSDQILDAVMANLPPGLLDSIATKGRFGTGSGAGAKRKGNRRGRPRPSRFGRLSGQNRLDLVGTLRAATPWQRLRNARAGRISILPSDFRIRQYDDLSDRLLIFTVDASGSAAMARLGEAKGAVELLLSEAYARRDHVSLISFRGDHAETVLPPTRSLVQTKRRLSAMPGGGGTPLAAGLAEAMTAAIKAKTQGMSPCIVLLTDGRANIALDGTAERSAAGRDATTVSQHIRAQGLDAIVLDVGTRPTKDLAELARTMDGLYLPLPRADAKRMSDAVSGALGT